MFFGDFTSYILLVLPAMILALYAQGKVKSTFDKYSKTRNLKGLTGAEAARIILQSNNINDVRVESVAGNLTDHYDPRNKVLRLSQNVYNSSSLSAVGVAAHECGHAVQDAQGYSFLSLRSLLVPAANIGSRLSMPLILVGILFSATSAMGNGLIQFGIILFGLSVVFTVITLPVEFNASSRAIANLGSIQILDNQEIDAVKKVLNAAALTYVAATAVALANFLRLILIFGRRNSN